MPVDSPFQDPLTHFGVDFIDAETGGLIRDKLYLLHGPSSPWKTALALHFVHEGLRNDQRAVYVTSQDPDAVLLQAERLGFDLRPHVRSERLVLLAYHPRISQHLESQNDCGPIFDELHALAGPGKVARMVFDPVVPLIEQTNKRNILPATRLLIEALQGTGATTLCIVDEGEEPHIQVILKEFSFLSFGAFELAAEANGRRVFRFRKVIWNPRDYPEVPLALRTRYGVQVLEPAQVEPEKPRLTLAVGPEAAADGPGLIPLPRPYNLLLVDADEYYHELLASFLGPRFRLTWVRDSVEALSHLLENPYDLVLANMNMPRVDGRELVLRIRQHHPAVPLVAYSGTLKRGVDAAGALRVGADMFLTRPLAFNYVKAAIEAVLRRPATNERFARTLQFIRLLEEESRSLGRLAREDPVSGLVSRAYFEEKVRREIEKAASADYAFSLVGYRVYPSGSCPGLEDAVRKAFLERLRREDLVMRQGPGEYLAYLEECLKPGVKRVDERLEKAIERAIGGHTFVFQSAVALFPGDAQDYPGLVRAALGGLRTGTLKLKRLS